MQEWEGSVSAVNYGFFTYPAHSRVFLSALKSMALSSSSALSFEKQVRKNSHWTLVQGFKRDVCIQGFVQYMYLSLRVFSVLVLQTLTENNIILPVCLLKRL